jgi:hypothetical protein
MARQPITSKYPKTGLALGPGFLDQRPEAAALVGQCITIWAEVELRVARLLAKMLHANTAPAIAMYQALRNERARKEVLDAVADFTLDGSDRDLYDAISAAKTSLSKQRNDLAHGLFGIASESPDGIAWISLGDRLKHMIEIDAQFDRGERPSISQFHKLKDFVSIYEIRDLAEIKSEMEKLHEIIRIFISYIGQTNDQSRAELYQRITSEPIIQKSAPHSGGLPGDAPFLNS